MSIHRNKRDRVKKVSKPKIVNKNGVELTRHHLVPKTRIKYNTDKLDLSDFHFVRILKLWRNKHDAWHFLFHSATLHEIRLIIDRLDDMNN